MKDQMTAQELGNLLGITASRVRELTRTGVLSRVGGGGKSYVVARNVKAAFTHLRAGAAGRSGRAAAAGSAARARLVTLQADRVEREAERDIGKWLPAAEVERQWSHRFSGIKAAVLSISTRFPYLDRTTCTQIDADARQFLNDVANGEFDVRDDPDARG
jgi:hypothetical protein